MSFTGHTLGKINGLADAAKVVVEGKTNIYELVAELTDEQASGFMGAAAAAKEEGKDTFVFDGKEYPVTIAAEVAKKIADAKDYSEDEEEIEEEEIQSLVDAIKSGAHLATEEEEVTENTTDDSQSGKLSSGPYGGENEARDPNIFKSNDEVAPDTKTGIEGHDDSDEEEKDGEEEESEEAEVKTEALDPVGKEDDDVDNDGDVDDSDEYLKKKRDAIGKAMKEEDEEESQEESFDLALIGKLISEGIDLDEGKMKELHALVAKGIKDPKKIAKELGLKPSKDTFDAISSIIAGM